MSVLKLSKNDIYKNGENDKRIKLSKNQISYDSAMISGWETRNKEAYNTLEKYHQRINSGGYLSADDLSSYRKALDSYADTSKGLRGLAKVFGQDMGDEQEWSDSISQLQSGYKGLSDYYSQWKTEADFKVAMEQAKANEQRMAELTNGYDPAKHQQEAKAGWESYVAYTERKARNIKELEREQREKPWWEKLGEYLGDIGSDSTLPGIGGSQVLDMQAEARRKEMESQYPDERWTDEHREIFGYLWANDRTNAYAYASYVNDMLDNHAEAAKIKEIQEAANSNFFAGAVHTLGAIVTSPLGLADYLGDLIYQGAVGYIPQADGEITPFEYSQAVTSGVSQHLNDVGGTLNKKIPVIGGKGWGDVYGLGTSIAQSSLAAATGGKGQALVTFFGSAAASGVDDKLSRGASGEQAVTYGMLSGIAEGLAESLGIDKLMKIGSSNTMRELVMNVLKQGAAEGLEEGVTTLMNNFADQLVMQDKSDFAARVHWYRLNDLSESDAKKQAWMDMANDLAFDMVGGFVSGAVHAGPKTAYQTYLTGKEMKTTYGGFQQDLVSKSLEIDPNNAFAQKMQGRLDKGKNLSGSQLNRLVQQNTAAITAHDMSSIQSAAENRLAELGETGDISTIAEALTKQAVGEKLSRAEQQAIANSKYGGNYSSARSEQIDTNRINAQEYSRLVEAAQLPQGGLETTGSQIVTEAPNTAQVQQAEPVASSTETTTDIATSDESSVTADGVTRQVSSGQEVTPKRIASISGGKVMIATDSGTVSADDIEFGDTDTDMLWRSATQFQGINVAGANGIIHAYRSGQPVATYLHGAAQEFRNGYYNMESGGEYADKLTPSQRKIIYELGQKAAGENTAKAQAVAKNATTTKRGAAAKKSSETADKKEAVGTVHFDRKGRTFDQKRETALKTMEQLSKVLGVEFYVFESYVNEAGERVYKDASGNEVHAPNGYYDLTDGSIHIDLNAGTDGKGTMLFTIAHELTHFIKQWSPAKFKVLANFLITQYGKNGVSVEELVETQIAKANKNGRTIDYDAAFEEVVADSMEAMLVSGNVVQMMAELKQRDKTLWQKICEWFKDLVADIKAVADAYKDHKPDSIEGRMIADMQDVIVVLESLYTDALTDAAENYQSTKAEKNTSKEGGEAMFSLRGENKDGIEVYETSEEIKRLPYKERQQRFLEIMANEFRGRTAKFIRNGHAYYATFDEKDVNKNIYGDKLSDSKGWKAKINVGANGNIFELVENAQYNGSLPEKGKKIAAHRGVGYWDYFIKNVQIDDTVYDLVANVRKKADGAYVYSIQLNQNKTIEASPPRGSLLRALSGVPNASKQNVAQDADDVKEKFSDRDSSYIDAVSRGDMEAAQQMVDEAAKAAGYDSPLLYHGTRSFGFTEFDLSKMDDKRSIFLTDNERIAATYSGVMGKRDVSGDKMKSIEELSNAELVEELNSDKFGAEADADDKFHYSYLSLRDVNQLINSVNGEIDALKKEVPQIIRKYADQMATDFDGKDHRTHEQLVKLDRLLQGYAYPDISTQLYMLLHYTDAFNTTEAEASRIAKLEQNIRLMNKLAHRDNSEGVIVESWLNGYSLNVLDKQQAGDKLAAKRKTGNYGMYAKLGNALVIDANGARWNDIRHWSNSLGIRIDNTAVERHGEEYILIDTVTGKEITEGRLAVNPYTKDMSVRSRQAFMVQKAQDSLSIITEGMDTTREIAAFAQKRGYESVVFQNLRDNGGQNAFIDADEAANIYVLFNPEQAKSADPVTYDDQGNVIPLSQRFEQGKSDIRYSERDYTYEKLVSKPDMVVTEVDSNVPSNRADVVYQAKQNAAKVGKTDPKTGSVSVRVEDIDTDVVLSTNGLKHGLDRRFSILAPVTVKAGEILKNAIRVNEMIPQQADATESYALVGAARNARGELYIIRAVINRFSNELVSMDVLYAINAKKEPAALLPEITDKTATRTDSDGKPSTLNAPQDLTPGYRSTISIAELLDLVNQYFPDILPEDVLKHYGYDARPEGTLGESALYSERNPELEKVNRVLEKENAELKGDVSYLRELLRLQRTVTGGTKFTKTSVEAAAGQLMKYADAKGDKTELAKLLSSLYEHIAKGEELTWDGVKESAQPAVEWLQSHTNTRKQTNGYAGDILREIRSSKVSLDASQKEEAAYRFGSYNEFRKKAMGSIIVADQDAIPLDSQWQEWSSLYPNIFDPETTSTDMPAALLNAVDRLRSMREADTYGYDKELFGQDLLRQVYDSYWNVSTIYTVADKAQKDINRLKLEHSKRMSDLRQFHKEKTAQLKAEHREALQKVKREQQERLDRKLQQTKEQYQQSREKNAENRRKAEMRKKIRRTIMDLDKLLNKGDKKRNVKEDMKDLVSETLKSADILFTDNYSNEDMVRYGVGTELTEKEAKYIEEAQELMEQLWNLPSGSYEAFQERQEIEGKLKGQLSYRMGKLQEVFSRERARLNKTKVADVLGSLADAYASLESSDQNYVSEAYQDNVYQYLLMLKTDVGGTIVKDMSLNQLEELHKAYTMVLTTVRNANKMFAANLQKTREQLGNQVISEVQRVGGEHGLWLPGEDKLSAFSWNNQKPVYAFERIGSQTLIKLFENIRAGEDRWALDMTEAREYYLEQIRKHKYDSWDFNKQYHFTSASGIDFSLNLEQIMSLYAYSKREQAHDHLLKGGFVFDGNTKVQVNKIGIKVTYLNKTAKAHNVSMEILTDIVSTLTAEQKAFVDAMQDYLSATMGEKGNEVSLQLYGVKLFNEQHYFPLRSAGQFMERAKEADMKKQQGQISIVNSGFAKATTPKSSNPVVLSGFMDVWADHVNEMSMYHSFVLPMEDFRRVYNYSSPNMEDGQSVSVNSVIQDAYGEAATGYIDQLYRDLNGGAVSDPRETPAKALIGKFKKAAVFASLSVVVQQPSAIGRAFAIIDPKHFIGSKVDSKRHKALWEELKKYAPVAVIKEMGYFDTGMGKSAQDFIKAKEYGTLKEKAAALFTNGDYRDELLSKAPALADELTWCTIWEAAKRETKAKNPDLKVSSEEFLQLAGKRFTEVITKTQVYDSVLSRSANMRSKGALMSMWTAFMAEPTTTINMMEDALRKGKRGDKKYAAKAMGAALTSVILNSVLSSMVYAMWDDDEDETFLEKYAQSFATEILEGVNPITYYPFLKDVWSALQGFDIERADMSLITSLTEKITKLAQVYAKDTGEMDEKELAEYNKKLTDAWWGVADYVTAFAGIPVKNVRRDINGAINTVKTIASDLTDRDTSWGSLVDKTWDGVKNSLPIVGWLPDKTAADRLYTAIVNGDTAYQKRMQSSYATESALNSAIRKGLRANDSRIVEAAIAWNNKDMETYWRIAKEIIAEGNFSQDNVAMAIQAEAKARTKKESNTN